MASVKISELTALTTPAAADELAVVDVSANSTKKITVGEVVGIINGDVEVANDGTASISELPVSKLQDGAARQLIQTDAAGTGVEWTSNIDIPGTLDVTGASTLDSTLSVAGVATFAAGSAGSPSLTFTGDANSGVYSPGADQVSVATGGSERLRIDAAGQIEAVTLGSAAAPTYSWIGDPNSGVFSPAADTWAVSTGGSERIRVDSSGRLGLGTTSPVGLLDVRGEIKAGSFDSINGTTLLSDSYATGGASFGSLCIERGTGVFALTTNIKHAENAAGYISTNTVDFGKSALKLGSTGLFYATASASVVPIGNSVSLTDKFVITNAGNVLIGTSSDSGGALLQVNGDRVRIATAKTPASATDTGVAGEICWDANYVYVCTATNTWKRTAIATW
jgi:hypothetical protein